MSCTIARTKAIPWLILLKEIEMIKTADWIIDIGPEGGKYGGELNGFIITPETVNQNQSHIPHHLT